MNEQKYLISGYFIFNWWIDKQVHLFFML